MSEIQPFTRYERAQLAYNAKCGVSPTPSDVLRYEASFDLVEEATGALHNELNHLACRGDASTEYESRQRPGDCECTSCCLYREVSDPLTEAMGGKP